MKERKEKEEKIGKKLRGRKPKKVEEKPGESDKVSITDSDSRIMKTRTGCIQGYNAQIAVNCDSQVIVATDLTQDHNDNDQLVPMMNEIKENTGKLPKRGVMNAGYGNEEQIKQLRDDIDLYIPTQKDWKQWKAMRDMPPPRGRIPKKLTLREQMERKLLTKKGKEIYKKRGTSVDPVYGQIKNCRRLDRLSLRRLQRRKGE